MLGSRFTERPYFKRSGWKAVGIMNIYLHTHIGTYMCIMQAHTHMNVMMRSSLKYGMPMYISKGITMERIGPIISKTMNSSELITI